MGVRNRSGLDKRWVARDGVSTRMVRNLGMRKITLFLPTRSDQYKTGPLDVNFTMSATIIIGIMSGSRARTMRDMSKSRFIN